MCWQGRGADRNEQEAARWFRLAAGQGYAQAQTNLGLMYARGQGVPQDDREAAKWLRQAADQGRAVAQVNLALMLMNGRGMPRNLERARQWVMADAQAGDKDAQLFLAGTYLEPGVGKVDEEQGLLWLQRAIDNGSELAVTRYASWLYYERNTAQSRSQAVAMLDKASSAGNSYAINNYAWILCTSPLPEQYDAKRGLALIVLGDGLLDGALQMGAVPGVAGHGDAAEIAHPQILRISVASAHRDARGGGAFGAVHAFRRHRSSRIDSWSNTV